MSANYRDHGLARRAIGKIAPLSGYCKPTHYLLIRATESEVKRSHKNIEILDETEGADEWIFEGVHTTPWFGFKDDFVVRLRKEGAMTRVDVRSKSRIGGSDIGMNARRIRDFMARLEKVIPGTTAS